MSCHLNAEIPGRGKRPEPGAERSGYLNPRDQSREQHGRRSGGQSQITGPLDWKEKEFGFYGKQEWKYSDQLEGSCPDRTWRWFG